MKALVVTIYVKAECTEKFEEITRYNSQNSLKEPGCLRFDVLKQIESPNVYNLYEIYKTDSDIEHHRTTEHYKKWRDTVADMMAQPRVAAKCDLIEPKQ